MLLLISQRMWSSCVNICVGIFSRPELVFMLRNITNTSSQTFKENQANLIFILSIVYFSAMWLLFTRQPSSWLRHRWVWKVVAIAAAVSRNEIQRSQFDDRLRSGECRLRKFKTGEMMTQAASETWKIMLLCFLTRFMACMCYLSWSNVMTGISKEEASVVLNFDSSSTFNELCLNELVIAVTRRFWPKSFLSATLTSAQELIDKSTASRWFKFYFLTDRRCRSSMWLISSFEWVTRRDPVCGRWRSRVTTEKLGFHGSTSRTRPRIAKSTLERILWNRFVGMMTVRLQLRWL